MRISAIYFQYAAHTGDRRRRTAHPAKVESDTQSRMFSLQPHQRPGGRFIEVDEFGLDEVEGSRGDRLLLQRER